MWIFANATAIKPAKNPSKKLRIGLCLRNSLQTIRSQK
jgi:hypothetical protein